MEDGIFSTTGRIRRSTYLLRWACIKIPHWIIKITLAAFIFGLVIDPYIMEANMTIFIIAALLYIFVYIIQLILLLPQIVKRLHDMNQSGWLALLILLGWIPYIGLVFNLIFFLFLIAVDGTIGENQYGEDPKQRVPYTRLETN